MKEISKPKKKKKLGKSYNWQFWAIIALPMIYAFVFAYIPMGGIIVAFQKYSPRKGILGSEVGWTEVFLAVLYNTIQQKNYFQYIISWYL